MFKQHSSPTAVGIMTSVNLGGQMDELNDFDMESCCSLSISNQKSSLVLFKDDHQVNPNSKQP